MEGNNADQQPEEKAMKTQVTIEGVYPEADYEVSYAAAINLMDDELREALADEMYGCTEQEFIDAYAKRHAEKYGEAFQVN
jgi:hypothetical protein